MNKRQVVLVILDGWGIGPKNESNPIYIQGAPNIDYVKKEFLIGALQASGISVGLPWNEEGNSEVGHLTIGAGKVLYQHYPRITLSIRDGSFSKNRVFLDAFAHTKKNKSALNIAGLLTEGNIHASFEHLVALIKIAKDNKVPKINLHIFSDGKDSAPKSISPLLQKLSEETGDGWKIGSLSGRYYALERDSHWDLTAQTYNAMIGEGLIEPDIAKIIAANYSRELNDQYIEPHTLDQEFSVKENDALLFLDFREDGIRQIAASFIQPNFSEFPAKKFTNLYIGTMTNYSDQLSVPAAYPPEKVKDPLAKILADNNKTQIHVAETEKYAHVTYFFNGYKEQPFPGEYRIIVPSEKLTSYADKPQMRASEITSRVVQAIQEQSFDFILANYANGDMIAHTGNYDAGKIAVKTIDEAIGALVRETLANNSIMIITADHGNLEIMTNPRTGESTTTHDPSPVPIYIIGNEFIKEKSASEIAAAENETIGILSDVAPTILEVLGIRKPPEMTGESLLKILK